MRVQILKEYVKENFPATPLLDYALEVEKITTSKVLLFQTYIWHFRKHSSDRKSTRLNSSHQIISYAVFCLKKKKKTTLT